MNPELPSHTSEPLPPPLPRAPDEATTLSSDTLPLGHHARLLSRVRSRQRKALWLEGLLWGGAALVLCLLGAGLVGTSAPLLGRTLFVLAPIALGASLVLFGIFLALARVGDETRTARLIGERVPALSHDLLSAVELSRALEGAPPFSPTLAQAFVRQLDLKAEAVHAREVVDPRPVQRAAMGLVGVLLLGLVVAVTLGKSWTTGMRHVLASGGSPAAATHLEPITGEVELTYGYPAYTGLAPKTVPGTTGEVTAPVGTEVRLKTRADREVGEARIEVNGKALPLEVDGGRDLSGSFIVEASGAYQFVFVGGRGQEIARGPKLTITAQPDTVPKVSLLTPGEEIEVDPGQKLTLKYEATDDYGITSLELAYQKPGAEERRVAVPREDGRATRSQFDWDLTELGLKPGDRVTYRIEAKDNDAVAGPKRGVSRTHALKVYSASEHRREAMARVEALWEKLVLHLADRLEGPEQAQKPETEKLVAATGIDSGGAELVTEMRAAAQELSKERDAPEELWTALVTVADGLGAKVRDTSEARRFLIRTQGSSVATEGMTRRLIRAANAEITEAEKDVLYLESLLDRQKLQELQELGKELANGKRELASLIEKYQQTKDPAVQTAVMEQIQSLRTRLEELMQRMSALAKGIRDEHVNAEALRELMQEKDMGAALDDIEKLMQQGNAEEALKKLQELSMQMDEMLQSLDGADERMDEEQFPELAQKFGELMEDMQQTSEAQKKVAAETKALRDGYKEKMRQRLKEKGEALRRELLKEVKSLRQEYQAAESAPLGPGGEETLDRLASELENVERALDATDFDMAAESAGTAYRQSQELAYRAQQQQQADELMQVSPGSRRESQRAAQKLQRNAERVSEVNRKLQELFPPPGSMMSEADRQKLDGLSKQQRALEKQAQGLAQKMGEIGEMAPVFDSESSAQMNEITQRMGDAAQRLEGRDPGRGHGEQQAALEGLDQLQKQMQESKGKGGGKGGGMPRPMMSGSRRQGMGQQQSQEKVAIPEADEYQAPREFRKDLLDAMKQGAPEKYRDQVKRYYEELVK